MPPPVTPLVTRALGYTPPIKPIRGTLLAVDPMPPTIRHTIVASKYYYWQLAGGHVAGGGTVDDVEYRSKALREPVIAKRWTIFGTPT